VLESACESYGVISGTDNGILGSLLIMTGKTDLVKRRLKASHHLGTVRSLAKQSGGGTGKRSLQCMDCQVADQRVFELVEDPGRKLVEAAGLSGFEVTPAAGERQRLVAQLVDPVLRLLQTPALDADVGADGVVNAKSEHVLIG
jgi:hypothetical protein